MGMKTCMNDDTFVVDVYATTRCITALEGPSTDKICMYDNLAWFFPIDFKVIQGGRHGQQVEDTKLDNKFAYVCPKKCMNASYHD